MAMQKSLALRHASFLLLPLVLLGPSQKAWSSLARRTRPKVLGCSRVCGNRAVRCRRSLAVAACGKERLAANVAGDLYVDESCINCDTCRWMAPETFGYFKEQSFVHTQPEAPGEERDRALKAMVACPTGSIRLARGVREPRIREIARNAFPLPVDAEAVPGVFHLGYHSAASFGATSYLVLSRTSDGSPLNVMIDSPRFNSKLADRIEAMGGLHWMLLTHKDDVADHIRWKARFPGLTRVIHEKEVRGPDQWPYIDMRGVERQLEGGGPWELVPGLTAVHTPGHSAGSMCFLASAAFVGGDEGVLFTGDHLAFSARVGRLDGFARYGWELQTQAASMANLADLPFSWILPGHGRRWRFDSKDERRDEILRAAKVFSEDPHGVATAPGPVWRTK